MAHIWADRVKETSTTTGTGSLTLAGAVVGYRAFSAVCANGDTVCYAIAGRAVPAEWEVGLGTWSTGGLLARTTVYASSNAGAAVNLSAGNKEVYLAYPAKAVVAGNELGGIVPPVLLTMANAGVGLQTKQTADQTYNYPWRGETLDPNAAKFGILLDGTPFFVNSAGTFRDNMMILGYNPGPQNSPPNTLEPSMTLTIEHDYALDTPVLDTHLLECYFQFVPKASLGLPANRPLSMLHNRNTNESHVVISSDKVSLCDKTGATPLMQVIPTSNQINLGVSTLFVVATNNSPALRQTNAAGTQNIPLIWLDNGNFIVYGHSTASIKAAGYVFNQGTSTGVVLPAGFAANFGAPLRFQSGPVMTTPFQGCMEWAGDDLTFVPSAARGRTTVLLSDKINLNRTVTAAGTTGAQTINKLAGSVNFAAGASTLVVTNSLATATSLIFITPQTNDATAKSFSVTRAAGSFTITANAACTGETAVAFLVTN